LEVTELFPKRSHQLFISLNAVESSSFKRRKGGTNYLRNMFKKYCTHAYYIRKLRTVLFEIDDAVAIS